MKRFRSKTTVGMTFSGGTRADARATGFGIVLVHEGDFRASDLIWMHINNSETDAGAMIGEDAKNQGHGGFLGFGEMPVAIASDALQILKNGAGDCFSLPNRQTEGKPGRKARMQRART